VTPELLSLPLKLQCQQFGLESRLFSFPLSQARAGAGRAKLLSQVKQALDRLLDLVDASLEVAQVLVG
jgi:hypothetical protein